MNDATLTLYEVIGVPANATQQVIEDACLKQGEKLRIAAAYGDARAAEEFARFEEAFETLGVPEKRRQYDKTLGTRQARGAAASLEEQYKAVLGPKNRNYYLERFFRFDQRGKAGASWHWPALFVTIFWLLYRKMWLYAFLYFVLAFIAPIPILVSVASLAGEHAETIVELAPLAYFAGMFLLPALYANAIYYRHCRKKIARAAAGAHDPASQLSELSDKGGTGNAAVVLVVAWLFIIPIGIMAAVAIPAYQDYKTRSRLADAEKYATRAARAVEGYFSQHKVAPKDLTQAGFTAALPPSVRDIRVNPQNGFLTITMDTAPVDGRSFILQPSVAANGTVLWKCLGNEIPAKYLPRHCRQEAKSSVAASGTSPASARTIVPEASTAPQAIQVPAPANAPTSSQGQAIMREANRAPKDRALQQKQLTAIDRELAQSPNEWDLHFARGLLLYRLGRRADAVAAYDATFKLNPRFAEAQYEAGTALLEMRKPAEAAMRLDAAGALDPRFFMLAAYNAGQAYYDNKEFKKALDRWSSARQRAPGDFDATKKVLQAQNALGLAAEAAATREALIQIWKTSTDARVRGHKDFVFDQFEVGTRRVMAYETLDPKGDLYYIYTFRVYTSSDGNFLGSVNLESSSVLREAGVPYIVGINLPDGVHRTTRYSSKTLPGYREMLRPLVEKLVAETFTK